MSDAELDEMIAGGLAAVTVSGFALSVVTAFWLGSWIPVVVGVGCLVVGSLCFVAVGVFLKVSKYIESYGSPNNSKGGTK